MRALWLACLFGVVLVAQGGKEDYPGQAEHKEPPKNYFCSSTALQKSHQCACKNMPRDRDDPICSTMEPEGDGKCKSYCWEKGHCLCKMACEHS